MLKTAFLAAGAMLVAARAQAPRDLALSALLKAKTQELLDSIALGSKAPWRKALAPHLVYVTENNEVLTKHQLVKEIEPLPQGVSGSVNVTNFELRRHGNTAIATYIAAETENYHGQILKTKYRTTDTWQRTANAWTIISSTTLAVLDDPPSVSLPDALLQKYSGRYELTPKIHYSVRVVTGRLMGQREGGKEVELKAESPDIFFVAGAPRSRKVFYRASTGEVVGFGDRREGHDVKWKRLEYQTPRLG